MAFLIGTRTRGFREQVTTDVAVGMALELAEPEVVLGRGPGRVHVPLADPLVSKIHARIVHTSKGYEIEDLNSRNGTFVNRRRLAAWHPTKLAEGDEVVIPPFVFVFRSSRPEDTDPLPEQASL
jgi:pSer/pThr/pTyr-binding forkhead associated (FHA) protein